MDGPVNEATRMGGGSDDIGDISWNMPTVTLRYPSNIPGLPGHSWANRISMATPIAHKGGVAGRGQAMTLLDILLTPKVVADAWDYFVTSDEGDEIHVVPRANDKAGDLAQRGHHGEVSRRDAEVLLRSDEVQDVPGPAWIKYPVVKGVAWRARARGRSEGFRGEDFLAPEAFPRSLKPEP
jgi:hypothetical protein